LKNKRKSIDFDLRFISNNGGTDAVCGNTCSHSEYRS